MALSVSLVVYLASCVLACCLFAWFVFWCLVLYSRQLVLGHLTFAVLSLRGLGLLDALFCLSK
jgi:hypothetical protein